jgi:hypothetical protein
VKLQIPWEFRRFKKGESTMPKKKTRKRTSQGKRRAKEVAAHLKKLETALTAVKKSLTKLSADPHHFV